MAETDLLLRMAAAASEVGDFKRARALYDQGARLGDAWCWHSLGYMHEVGKGGAVDIEVALKCYRKAWRQRNPASANNIAIIYREKGNRRAMFRWFLRAAEFGDDDAFLQLARCYREGVGVRRSTPDMIRYAQLASKNEFASVDELQEAEAMLSQHRPRSL